MRDTLSNPKGLEWQNKTKFLTLFRNLGHTCVSADDIENTALNIADATKHGAHSSLQTSKIDNDSDNQGVLLYRF